MTVARALDAAAEQLAAAGIAEARREARLLLAHALGTGAASLFADPSRVLDRDACDRFAAIVARRASREPASHILGRREFWSLDFVVTADVLDPRPDSEALVEAALAALPEHNAPLAVLDLGTGSGCLLLAVLSERPNARGLGIDASAAALHIAAENASRLGLAARATFQRSDWAEGIEARFDLILCNPPYIESGAIATLAPEVARWEPRQALDGGTDGLAAYHVLAPQFNRLLAPNGVGVVEVGEGQADAAAELFVAAGLVVDSRCRDLSGIERCLVLRRSRTFTKP
jgi:release factor glutamine methyltransferase